jgi:ubiquinone/menaquinone biosynthesis C-methylase UbiE
MLGTRLRRARNIMNNTERFSDRVDNYQKYRPSYTDETIDYIFNNFGLSNDSVIADIGSGTRIFTEKLLKRCKKVYAVEPNPEMRIAADKKLSPYKTYESINGTSENTTLDDKSLNGITVAQAFHWFNIEKTKEEFKRILKKDGYIFLIWNKRVSNTPFLSTYEKILIENIPEYSVVTHNNINEDIIKGFLTKDYSKASFSNNQVFDLKGVLGRLNSSSYTPKENTKEYGLIKVLISKAFTQYSENGFISFNYNTEIYSGKIT